MQKLTYDFDDILMKPAGLSTIESRKDVNIFKDGMLPLFTAPMDTVVNQENMHYFLDNNINVTLPRIKEPGLDYFSTDKKVWYSYGLDDFIKIFIDNRPKTKSVMYALIDVANGNMKKLIDVVKKAKKKYGDNLVLMVGNIANTETYEHLSNAGADFTRVGIGNGGACTTTYHTGIGYPMASLIKAINETSLTLDKPALIVADGGFKKYSDIIKALALGADYVMLGSIFNKALESAGETRFESIFEDEIIDQYSEKGLEYFNHYKNNMDNCTLYKTFRGMSTKEVQKSWGRENLKTSEGVTRQLKVEYTISGWVENFSDYLRSAMSYCNSNDIYYFSPEFILISQKAYERFNK